MVDNSEEAAGVRSFLGIVSIPQLGEQDLIDQIMGSNKRNYIIGCCKGMWGKKGE